MLKNILEIIKKHKIIIAILFIGLAYRIYGVYFDYPFSIYSIWDETYSLSYLLDLLHYKSFSLAMDPYPILLPILYAPILALRVIYLMTVNHLASVDSLYNFLAVNGMGYVHIITRWYSVFLGVGTIFLICRVATLAFRNKMSGYFAAAAYAVSLVPVAMAHWGKAHIPMIFFLIFSLFFALKYEECKKNKFLYLCVLASVLSFSTHYLGISAFIFPFTAWIFNREQIKIKVVVKNFLIVLAGITVFFLPNLRGIANMLQRDAVNIASHNFLGMYSVGIFERFFYVWQESFMVEPIFIFLLATVLLISGKKIWGNIYTRYILIGLAFNYFLMTTIFAAPLMIRFLLTFLTLAIILSAGYFISYLNKINIKKITAYLILLILLLPGAYFSYRVNLLLNNFTKNELVSWLENNLKSDEFAYSFDLYIDAPLSYESAKWTQDNNLITTSKKINYIASRKDEFSGHGLNLLYDLGFNRYNTLGGPQTKYVIVTYWESGNLNKRYDFMTKKEASEIVGSIKKFHSISLEKIFYPSDDKKIIENGLADYINNPLDAFTLLKLEKSGPFIDVYKINN